MTATTHKFFLLIIQDVQLIRSVLNLSLSVLNQAPLAGLLLRNNRLPSHGTLALSKFFEIYKSNVPCSVQQHRVEG